LQNGSAVMVVTPIYRMRGCPWRSVTESEFIPMPAPFRAEP
jgi:hypothetical protein